MMMTISRHPSGSNFNGRRTPETGHSLFPDGVRTMNTRCSTGRPDAFDALRSLYGRSSATTMERIAALPRSGSISQAIRPNVSSQPREVNYAMRDPGQIVRDLILECNSRKSC